MDAKRTEVDPKTGAYRVLQQLHRVLPRGILGFDAFDDEHVDAAVVARGPQRGLQRTHGQPGHGLGIREHVMHVAGAQAPQVHQLRHTLVGVHVA